MRVQYHFRRLPRGLCAWDVRRLVELSSGFAREQVPLSEIRELDEPYWAMENANQLTVRQIAEHARLAFESDLGYPVILSSDGRVMDGMHRICKAVVEGHKDIEAVRFVRDPEPDFIDVNPDDLPYEDDAF